MGPPPPSRWLREQGSRCTVAHLLALSHPAEYRSAQLILSVITTTATAAPTLLVAPLRPILHQQSVALPVPVVVVVVGGDGGRLPSPHGASQQR